MTRPDKPIKLFYSYSHQDEPYRKKLETCLSGLKREGLIQEWHDRKILPGQSWAAAIDGNLESADLVLLLISPDFIASDYCHEIEMKRALQRHSAGLAEVVAVIIKPADWQHSDFAKLQVLPANGKPVQKWKPQGDAFLDIALGLRKLVESLRGSAGVSPGKADKAGKTPALHPLCAEYLRQMIQEWRDLPLRALASRACDPGGKTPPMDLEQIYVALDTTTPKLQPGKQDEFSRDNTLLPASEALAQAGQGRMVLLGQPGSGKSTFGRYLALVLAEDQLNPAPKRLAARLPGWTAGPLLPVFVPLRRLASRLADAGLGRRDLAAFIQEEIECRAGLKGYGAALTDELAQRGGLVVFDGLDEVAAEYRETVKRALADFAERHLRCRVLATCRVHSYKLDPAWRLGWETHELADFSAQRIASFIDAWFKALVRITPAEQATLDRKAQTLQTALGPEDPRGLRELAGKPLLLTVMAIVHNHKELPGSRVGVYRECVDILLQRWEAAKLDLHGGNGAATLAGCGLEVAVIHDALHEIAYRAHKAGTEGKREGLAVVKASLISAIMSEFNPAFVPPFLEHCRHANGLLLLDAVEQKNGKTLETYRFPHLSFQEYLAALQFNALDDGGIEEAAQRAGDPAWWEVVRFFGEYLCYDETAKPRPRDINALLEGLCPDAEADDDAAWRRAWLAGLLVPGWETRVKESLRPVALKPRIIQRLVRLVESPTALRGEQAARASAGRALGVLGDPRPGVGVRDGLPDILWVTIAGTRPQGCKLGNGVKPDEEGHLYEDWPKNKAPLLIDDFQLAAYPVTVAQYECFVLAGGYETAAYWSEAGWQAVGKHHLELQYWQDRLWHQANHPAVGTSYWEAEAFCRWLSAKLNRTIRLPTEAEWEWAARGAAGRRYPWGEDWDTLRANTDESKISRTTAVGLYPEGAMEDGQDESGGNGQVYDLAGNVWEWTVSAYSADYARAHALATNKDNVRMLRGGSWLYDSSFARASCRHGIHPDERISNIGFRLVCAPFPSLAAERWRSGL